MLKEKYMFRFTLLCEESTLNIVYENLVLFLNY